MYWFTQLKTLDGTCWWSAVKNWPAKGGEEHSISGPGNKIPCAPE